MTEEHRSEDRPYYGRTWVQTAPPRQREDGPITRFRLWYADADRGATYVYHTGDLHYDRWDWAHGGIPADPLDSLARLVMDYSRHGYVVLTQRRLSGRGEARAEDGPYTVYEYRATKIRV